MPGPFRLNRALIRVSGPDTGPFLSNLLTQDVDPHDEQGVRYAALLTPQGKVIADMLVWPDAGDGVVLEVSAERAPDLERRLSMYKLRANVNIENATDRFQALYAPETFRDASPDPRFPKGELGWRALRPSPPEQSDVPTGEAVYDARRIALGVPDLARDAAPEEVFALEGLLEELHGVDFQKGCFVGQENVSRMKRRATTRKKFCPVVFDGDPPAHGTPVSAGPADLGAIRTGAAGRAIALLRLDRALAAEGSLMADGKPVRLDPPPWLILPEAQA